MGDPDISDSETEKLKVRLGRVQAKLQEGQRRCDARDDDGDVRCGRADEGLPESTANEFRYILVPAKSWGEYNPADDESVPGAVDQRHYPGIAHQRASSIDDVVILPTGPRPSAT